MADAGNEETTTTVRYRELVCKRQLNIDVLSFKLCLTVYNVQHTRIEKNNPLDSIDYFV